MTRKRSKKDAKKSHQGLTVTLLSDKLLIHIRVIPGMWSLLVEVRPRDGVTGNRKRVCEQRVGNDPADRLRDSLHI
jgi:hypothetical protein